MADVSKTSIRKEPRLSLGRKELAAALVKPVAVGMAWSARRRDGGRGLENNKQLPIFLGRQKKPPTKPSVTESGTSTTVNLTGAAN